MGNSAHENKSWAASVIYKLKPKTVLDIGPGEGIISIPITHFHQDAANGNPYETHVKEDWTTKEVLDSFHSIILKHEFSITGTYLAKFDKPKKKK